MMARYVFYISILYASTAEFVSLHFGVETHELDAHAFCTNLNIRGGVVTSRCCLMSALCKIYAKFWLLGMDESCFHNA